MKAAQPITQEMSQPPSREAEADRDLRATVFTSGSKPILVAAMLLILIAVPITQAILDARAPNSPSYFVQDKSAYVGRHGHDKTLLAFLPTKRQITTVEKALERRSWLRNEMLPMTQWAVTRFLGGGSKRVYPGRAGWFYYYEDIESLTDPPFLSDKAHGDAIYSEIVGLSDDLKARGIALVVVPMPVKPVVYPERFTMRYDKDSPPLVNASYGEFVQTLRARGVRVWEPLPMLIAAKRQANQPLWLRTDSHCAPQTIEMVADGLADYLTKEQILPTGDTHYTTHRADYNFSGDLIELLKLQNTPIHYSPTEPLHPLYPPDKISVRTVLNANGKPCLPDYRADVLLIGDSYTRYYTWANGGLMEQLAYRLRRPMDRMILVERPLTVIATILRERKALTGYDPLTHRKLVIFEFATRRLNRDGFAQQDLHGLGTMLPSTVATLKTKSASSPAK